MNCCNADGAMERLELGAMFATWLYNNTTPLEGGVSIVSRVRLFPVDDVAVIIVEPAVCGVIVVTPLDVPADDDPFDVITTFWVVVDTVNGVFM
jgi:hypothetical protein